jgi:hypothetical protein
MDTVRDAMEILKLDWISDHRVKIYPNIFRKENIYDIFWGDDQGQFLSALNEQERAEFEEGIRKWLREWREKVTKKYEVDPKQINLSSTISDNACIRTNSRLDKAIRHLGYRPVDVPAGETYELPRDVDIVNQSQERLARAGIIPDTELSSRRMASLGIIREINKRVSQAAAVYAALIPDASDRVHTAGMYGRMNRLIYISPEQLDRGRVAVNTGIHEMAHHNTGEEDGEDRHQAECDRLKATVVDQVSRGDYDQYLKNPDFAW